MILAVANTKGGVGKTTLAVNIAVARLRAGFDVLLVDADEQRTACDFSTLRSQELGNTGYTVVALTGASVREQVLKLAPKYDEVIIDVGGRDTTALRAALTVAETVLIPCQPRSFDIWALEGMAALVVEARLINPAMTALSMLNRADPGGLGGDNRDAADALWQLEGIAYLDAPIANRKAWPNAAARGRGILEAARPDAKAKAELEACLRGIYDVQRSGIQTHASAS